MTKFLSATAILALTATSVFAGPPVPVTASTPGSGEGGLSVDIQDTSNGSAESGNSDAGLVVEVENGLVTTFSPGRKN